MENITNQIDESTVKSNMFIGSPLPIRLCIVKGLMTNEGCNVSKMQDSLDIPQSTLSQHLAKLRNLGILEGERNGVEVNYYVVSVDAKSIIEALFY